MGGGVGEWCCAVLIFLVPGVKSSIDLCAVCHCDKMFCELCCIDGV